MQKQYYIYLATNKRNTVIYTGVTDNLARRISEHKDKNGSKFTKRYSVDKLVYYEAYNNPENAITREKQIKAGSRNKKIKLIESMNPNFEDLSNKLV
ncbi:MAG: GIY-YIG nuclease family protein [Candidatus Paceibacterota bacterium]|jgi:putative endonuclease